MTATEYNFDGLVGPTHNYAGLSVGNIASMTHRGAVSNPRAAALEGLAKMKLLSDLGVAQAILPPHPRPDIALLRAFGFSGKDRDVLRTAAQQSPELLRHSASSAGMWVANAATVAPSRDTRDHRVHFTPANLISKLHRSIEPPQTLRTLRAIFRDPTRFHIHEPLPAAQGLGDEGAANHTRFAPAHGARGLHFFVYGHTALPARPGEALPLRFPSRQSREASMAVARRHQLADTQLVFARQTPEAIDAGVFHNDVIAVGNENLLLFHEKAFVTSRSVIGALRRTYAALNRGDKLNVVQVATREVSLAEAVRSYLFNSQLVTLGPGKMALLAPVECQKIPAVRTYLEQLIASGKTPIIAVHYLSLRQSMRNGGGPACLRLRVVLTPAEADAMAPGIRFTPERHAGLVAWVNRHYRDQLRADDLADPKLLEESRRALDELTQLLALGSIYPFQE
jgi:succinylarginine dihydrolase